MSFHSKSIFAHHTVVDFSDQDEQKEQWRARMLCDEHPKERLQFYCLDCRMPVCAHCLILGEHKGHQNTPIDQAMITGRETLNAWVEKLQQRITLSEDLLEQLHASEREVQENAEAQRNVINTELDHLREMIETKRHQLLSKSALEEKQKRVALQAQVDRAEAVRGDSAKLVGRSEELLELPSEHAFLAVLLPLIQDMKKCASQPIDTAQHISCAFRPLSTDAQVRALGDLDLGAPRQMLQAAAAPAAPVASLSGIQPGRLQSVANQPLQFAAATPNLLGAPGVGLTPQYEGITNAYQMPLQSDAAAVAGNFSMMQPGYATALHASVPSTSAYLGSHQLPAGQAHQMPQLGQASMQQQQPQQAPGQVVGQNVYVYRSMQHG